MTVRRRRYTSLAPITVRRAETMLSSGDSSAILHALLRLSLHGPDFALAERKALEFAAHTDVWVRRNAATALGHVARLHGSHDLPAVMAALLTLLDDPEVSGWADDALDDVEHYMKTDRGLFLSPARAAAR